MRVVSINQGKWRKTGIVAKRVFMFDPETKRDASVVQIVFGRTEAGWWPVEVSGRRRDACGGKRFGPEVNINTL
jgi:hypothetical protein